MQDAPSGEATPAELDEDEEDEEDAEGEQDEEDAASVESDVPPARTRTRRSDAGSLAVATPTSTPAVPVKRRPGRPPKNRPPVTFDNSDQAVSDATPKRRGGFRGRSFGGGRWKNRGGPSRVSQVPVDKDGNMATVQDDEVQLEEDPEGEAKVDKLGHLQEGREYRVRTFTIVGRGKRLYMLSTEPARCIGFRDSYLFFQKHKQLFKIILSDDEKMDLIEREIMPHSYKGRSIGVVTARSVFREFGAKIIIGGRKVVDDYQAAACRANGDVEGELAVPDDVLPAPGGDYDRNRYVAWHGASSVYHTGAPTVPLQAGKEAIKKRKVTVTGINWQFEHAREARSVALSSPFLATVRW
jgi:chromatin structure-remodeling complex protein RSC7